MVVGSLMYVVVWLSCRYGQGDDPSVIASLEAQICRLCGRLGQRLLSQAMDLEGWRWNLGQQSPTPIEQGNSGGESSAKPASLDTGN